MSLQSARDQRDCGATTDTKIAGTDGRRMCAYHSLSGLYSGEPFSADVATFVVARIFTLYEHTLTHAKVYANTLDTARGCVFLLETKPHHSDIRAWFTFQAVYIYTNTH